MILMFFGTTIVALQPHIVLSSACRFFTSNRMWECFLFRLFMASMVCVIIFRPLWLLHDIWKEWKRRKAGFVQTTKKA